MTTFVLVHGAWYGAWTWRATAALLRTAGHEVYTPTLTGLGERRHLLAPTVDLHTHVEDIVQVLFHEDLTQVVLVGHSYGGMVISGVAERVPERLAQLVYFDAFVPRSGQSIRSMMSAERVAWEEAVVERDGQGWLLPPPAPEQHGIPDPAQAAWAAARVGPQPHACSGQSLTLGNPQALALPKTFILCTESRGPFRQFAEQVQDQPGWRVQQLATGHHAQLTAPEALVPLLLAAPEHDVPCP